MKKKLISLAAVLMAATVLTACSQSVSTSFSSNWYPNPATTNVLPNTNETLVYSVSMPADTRTNEDYYAEYTNGVYKTSLTDKGENYLYKTELTINVQYFVGDEKTEVFTDTVVSEVEFKGTQHGLRPVRSYKKVESRSPASLSPASIETCYKHYSYEATISYNDACTKGTYTYDNLLKEGVETDGKKFSITDKRSYLDNEQLLFGIRGITSSSSQSLSVFNVSTKSVQTVSVSREKGKETSLNFALNGEAASDKTVAYYPYTAKISSGNSGGTRTVWIASEAKYRGVIFRIEDPVSFSLGTLVYTLREANFSA
ncbi:MAG: hypothetical protein IJY62_00915 [Clostridia bacterium]|nr:hypothetical protein [Clostridia bacterium]